MDDDIHTVKGTAQTLLIAYIADKIAQAWMIVTGDPHLMLLELIAAENNDLRRVIFLKHHLDEFLAKRTGTAGDKYNTLCPIHVSSLSLSLVNAEDQIPAHP